MLISVSTVQCIGEAFGVNPADDTQRQKLSIKPATLQSLFDVYLKTKEKITTPQVLTFSPPINGISDLLSSCQTTGTSAGAKDATSGPPSSKPTLSAVDKSQAEQLKLKGNALMSSKDYAGAIAAYTSAIALDPTNPVYYSNRAAAHSSTNSHEEAVKDAQKAIEVDFSFVKAYHRLGSVLELFSLLPC
jgi:small glutamine-rich tetratricopeptide repeat-containing protein alpha